MAEMYDYAIDLRSMTQGRGSFSIKFSHYEEVPFQEAEKIIAAAKLKKEIKVFDKPKRKAPGLGGSFLNSKG